MSDLDAEGVVFKIYENLPRIEGFGAWNEATVENHMDADKLGFASGYFEITKPDGDRSSIHVTAAALPAQQQHAPEFGAAVDRAYDATDHKNGV